MGHVPENSRRSFRSMKEGENRRPVRGSEEGSAEKGHVIEKTEVKSAGSRESLLYPYDTAVGLMGRFFAGSPRAAIEEAVYGGR